MDHYQQGYPRRKLHRPRPGVGWVTRPRLLEQLDQVLQTPVALISGPAGFGKTTLLSQWLDRCPLPNAWLQLDKNDHEIFQFLTGVVAALTPLFPGCLEQTANLLEAQRDVPLAVWINTLNSDLELLQDTPFVLVLDDYHLVENPSIDLLIADILDNKNQSMHLILSARRSPPLSFSRLKVQEQVVEITTKDLRFTDAEAQAYLFQAANVDLSSQSLQQLQGNTEGWAAGLKLAAISFREETHPEALIAQLERSHRRVSDYLLDQAFNNQPVEIQDFLLKTASLKNFCAAMLADVFNINQSEGEIQTLLDRVEDAQLFLIPLDDQRTWYRYHHLFRQMLLSQQRIRNSPENAGVFQRRAAAWLIHQGQKDDALEYLIAVEDWTTAAQLVESQLCDLLNAESIRGIKRRLALFSEDFIATRPGLLLMQGWIAHFAFRVQELQSLTPRIQAHLDAAAQAGAPLESTKPPCGFESIPYSTAQAQIWALDALRYYLTNQSSQVIPLTQQVVASLPESWSFPRGNAMAQLGLSMMMEGKYHRAVELITQEYERLHNPNSEYGLRLLFGMTSIHILNGELELGRQAAEQLLQGALANNLLILQGWGYYLLGRIYQEWNQLGKAAEYYHQAVEKRYTANLVSSLESIAGYAYILQTLGRGTEALEFLNSLGNLHGEHSPAATPPLIASLVAWLNLRNGKIVEARRWAESFHVPIAAQSIIWYHIPQLNKIRILMETSAQKSSPEVEQLLDEIQELAERTHNNFTVVRVLAMRAFWQSRQGDRSEAQRTLERALRLARPGWFTLTFVDQGPEMRDLLQSISSNMQNEPELGEYIISLIAAFTTPPQSSPALLKRFETETLLTNREIEVLDLLAERLADKEIAVRLTLSSLTVKKHVQRICRKLGVNNRRAAVIQARRLGLI